MDNFWVFFIVFGMVTLIGILAARDAKKEVNTLMKCSG